MLTPSSDPDLSADGLSTTFGATESFTVGLEEEVMLLDPKTLDLSPSAPEALRHLAGDARFKAELPASQLEIVTRPRPTAAEAIEELAEGRRELAAGLGDLARPAAAGVHPFADPEGELSADDRYAQTRQEFGPIARLQLVTSLQVHVAVGGAERTLAVYNALRSHLPELAALAANAPVYAGRDTGLASVRPKIAELLPRQGLPPAIDSWHDHAEQLRWGAVSGSLPVARLWWWELRPHPAFGTLELRVADAQTTLREAAGVTAVAQALVADLAGRHDRGEALAQSPDWRIEENRWSAARHGVEGEMADLESGDRESTGKRLTRLIDDLGPVSERLGSTPLLNLARELVAENGAMRQRTVFQNGGARAVAASLTDRFLDPCPD